MFSQQNHSIKTTACVCARRRSRYTLSCYSKCKLTSVVSKGGSEQMFGVNGQMFWSCKRSPPSVTGESRSKRLVIHCAFTYCSARWTALRLPCSDATRKLSLLVWSKQSGKFSFTTCNNRITWHFQRPLGVSEIFPARYVLPNLSVDSLWFNLYT